MHPLFITSLKSRRSQDSGTLSCPTPPSSPAHTRWRDYQEAVVSGSHLHREASYGGGQTDAVCSKRALPPFNPLQAVRLSRASIDTATKTVSTQKSCVQNSTNTNNDHDDNGGYIPYNSSENNNSNKSPLPSGHSIPSCSGNNQVAKSNCTEFYPSSHPGSPTGLRSRALSLITEGYIEPRTRGGNGAAAQIGPGLDTASSRLTADCLIVTGGQFAEPKSRSNATDRTHSVYHGKRTDAVARLSMIEGEFSEPEFGNETTAHRNSFRNNTSADAAGRLAVQQACLDCVSHSSGLEKQGAGGEPTSERFLERHVSRSSPKGLGGAVLERRTHPAGRGGKHTGVQKLQL